MILCPSVCHGLLVLDKFKVIHEKHTNKTNEIVSATLGQLKRRMCLDNNETEQSRVNHIIIDYKNIIMFEGGPPRPRTMKKTMTIILIVDLNLEKCPIRVHNKTKVLRFSSGIITIIINWLPRAELCRTGCP